MKSKKQVISTLALLEKTLWIQQARLNKNKQYFFELFRNNLVMLSTLILPAFLTGWQCGKIPNAGQKFKQFGKLMSITLLAQAKKISA